MDNRASLLNQLRAYHQRQKTRFDRWLASGYRHELKPIHEPVPDELRRIPCAAKTRAGTPCKRTDISSNGRCKYHGGHSTGATTAEGKARQLEGYRRWHNDSGPVTVTSDVTDDGKSVTKHTHGGVETGSGSTGKSE